MNTYGLFQMTLFLGAILLLLIAAALLTDLIFTVPRPENF